MGVIIPQVVTTDRASGAQVIDGSLKFDEVSSSASFLTKASSPPFKDITSISA